VDVRRGAERVTLDVQTGEVLAGALPPRAGTVAWPNGADLSPRTLYAESELAVPDLDFIADLAADNMRRLAAALQELGAKVRGVDADHLEVDPPDAVQLASGANWTLVTKAGWLDFMPGAEGARDYAAIAGDAVAVRDGAFRVVGLDDLIRMKRACGRDKDIDDIVALTHREHPG
jgi:hypothetical protein